MREERGHIAGEITINEPYTLWGSIGGTVTALKGSKFYMRGAIYGDLNVGPGGRVHVLGNITGNVTVSPKAKLIVGGTVGGNVTNLGGRLYVEATAKILGKIRTHEGGETKVEPGAKATQV
ncbi:MAG TPA: polymer-forming cytoskeletal protein [Tepidisphaeraceae bacterium]|jgi:cytoskeletal protein CcmA (bactofilin family)|nr:polymer-forming cytoskeletal protein [Tepidisphaeraceae bacterium]